MEIIENGLTYEVNGGIKYLKTPPVSIRKIKPDLFRDRFTFSEKVRIKSSTDPVVQVFGDEANGRPYINLDHPIVQSALPYLRDNGILDGDTEAERQARMDFILADGTPEEAA